MKKVTKILLTAIMAVAALSPFTKARAAEPINVYIFHGDGCPHCQEALEFFDSIKDESMFKLVKYEVWYNEDNSALLQKVADKLDKEVSGVPFIVIGDKVIAGYSEELNDEITESIKSQYESDNRYDVMEGLEIKESSNTAVYIVLGVIIVGFVALLGFSKAKAN